MYVPLHVQSDYSLLESCNRIEELVPFMHDMGIKAIALTDRNNMGGTVSFYRKCKEYGIKPILGVELDVEGFNGTGFPLVLLAKNANGYRNLTFLTSMKKPIAKETLFTYAKDVIALSGGYNGELATLVRLGKFKEAVDLAQLMREALGEGHWYVQLELSTETHKQVARKMFELLPKSEFVASQKITYLRSEEQQIVRTLKALKDGKTLEETKILELSFLNYNEDPREFKSVPEALKNTERIADSIDYVFSNELKLPDLTHEYSLSELVYQGAQKRYGSVNAKLKERIEYELSIIKKLGFENYFLIVYDIVRFAREKSIPVGPGRGSAAGSVVAYCLGITDVDPLEFGLIFERFLNEHRGGRPDIDIDFCFERRSEIFEYVASRFGHERVAHIGAYGTFGVRSSIREVGRVLNVPEQIINGLLKRLNPKEPSLNDFLHQRLSPIELEIIDLASKLEGLKRHHTTHAAGIIIAPKAITEYASLEPTSEAIATTQMTMDDLEEMGLLKMDFLALKTLTILKDIEAKIRRWNPYFNLADIPKADPETFKLLQQGRTFGVFQLESTMFQELLKEFKPDKYGDLIAILALGRPGPMSHRREYVLRKSGKKPVDYLHPKLEPILEETFGFMIYQEQVIQIAHQIGGLSLSEADIMRVAMGKKDARLIENLKIKFIKGAVKNGLTSKQAEELFAEMERFAGYAFNKSHSACYALISWQMAYLKANFPYEFYVSLLNFKSDLEEIHACLEDCMNEGIEILPPDVVYSQSFYAREGMAIRVGLGKLKFMNKGIADEIIKQRTFRSFVDLADFLNRIRLNENIRHSLELSGSFRTLAPEREFPLDERNTIGTQLSTYNAKVWDPLLEELKSVFPSIVAGRIEEFLIDQGIPKGVVKGNGRKVRFQLTKSAKDFRRFFRVNEVIALLGRETNKDNVLFVEWALPLKSVLIISPLIKELGRLQKYLHQIRGESPVVFKFNSGELQLLPPKFWVKEGMINATELDPLVDQFSWIRDSLKGID